MKGSREMTYIWRAQKWPYRIVMHIQLHDRLRRGLNAAICGARMKFNRAINAPFGLGRPVCKNCLRSCVDKRIVA